MSNINKLGATSAVEDLTDAVAAVVEGGGILRTPIDFDDNGANTPSFSVRPGGRIAFASLTENSGYSGRLSASLKNTRTGRTTSPKLIIPDISGRGNTFWSNVRGGRYVIRLVSPTGTLDRGTAVIVTK